MVAGLTADGDRLLAVKIICPAIAVIACALRMWCKVATMKSGFRSFHADDWGILATTVTYLAAESAMYWGMFDGSRGLEIGEIMADVVARPSPEKLRRMENYLESLFIGITILYFALFLAKISVCLLYRRIFSTQPFRKLCLVFMAISSVYFVAAQIANLCICIPIDAFWHRSKPGRCLNFNLFSLAIGIFDILLDVAILLLPVRAVLSLQMPARTKVMVLGIFLLGGFAVITNILRVAYQYQPSNIYVNFSKSEIWCNIHTAAAILCACLPTYNPLRALLGRLASTIRDRYGSSVGFFRSGPGSSKSSHGQGSSGPRLHYPKSTMGDRHSSAKDISSTTELVLSPPMRTGHLHATGWYEPASDATSNGHLVPVPPRAIARTTTVDVV